MSNFKLAAVSVASPFIAIATIFALALSTDCTPASNNLPITDFENCTEAKAHGYHDFPVEPGSTFDRDNDGIGCEK